MRTYKQCLLCFERQATDVCSISKLNTKETEAILRTVKARIKTFPLDHPPIKMAVDIHDLVRSESGIDDPYAEIKKNSNQACCDCSDVIAGRMKSSSTPLKTATQLAIAGNIIDYGAYSIQELSLEDINRIIRDALSQPLTGDLISSFDKMIQEAKQILYIGDNAGECFFDVPLLSLMPSDKVTYVVRGGPVLNDATREDAYIAGIHDICPLVDTGDNAPGILLDRCSAEFISAFQSSDLIISKGQGNYESLSGTVDKAIVFLTKVKCEVIAKDISYPLNSNVIKICMPTKDMKKLEQRNNKEVCNA